MVTSSAVVGSSAMISSGLQARAMAIITRWRMPPENWWGYCLSAALGFGDAHLLQQLAAVWPAVVHAAVDFERLDDLEADRQHRIERGHRVLEDHSNFVAAHLAQLGGRKLQHIQRLAAIVQEDFAGGDAAGGAIRRMSERAVTLLPLPDSPTMPSTSPAATSKDTSLTA